MTDSLGDEAVRAKRCRCGYALAEPCPACEGMRCRLCRQPKYDEFPMLPQPEPCRCVLSPEDAEALADIHRKIWGKS